MKLKNVTLELSSKPFFDDTPEMMECVCRTMFQQWGNLTKHADQVSVLLWIADGSEILEYTGDLEQVFEWAYWCGCANPIPARGNETDREKINTHYFPKKYRENARPRTYAWLRELIVVIKRVGLGMLGKPIRVGAIFDNGPEFAISNFKYKKHPEIAQADTIFKGSFVTCNSTLHYDPQPYAAFSGGVPKGTTLGDFLGAQFKLFAQDMGYDYIWLSNGMGFGTETWGIKGALFDKSSFYPEKADEAAGTMLQFWRDFTRHWPADKIETRGSNFSAGVELASDAAPLKELYEEFKIVPPVNSPWAALNFNSGLELAAWMSHVAVLPGDTFPYRFYPHDPWFMNSPWLDRYGREPWDIYLPLGVSRIDEKGQTWAPNSVAFLTIDDTLGRMPDQVPEEVIPHIKQALRHAPDRPGPFVWLYPFFEYSEMVRGVKRRPDIVFNEDMFLGEAIQQGIPLNTVVSTDNFRTLMAQGSNLLGAAVIVAPVSSYASVESFIGRGGQVLFYGSLADAPEELLKTLGLRNTYAISGDFDIACSDEDDQCLNGGFATCIHVHEQFSGGGLTEVIDAQDGSVIELARADSKHFGESRTIAMVRHLSNRQRVGFVRSLLPSDSVINSDSIRFDYAGKDLVYPVEKLMRNALAQFGWNIRYEIYKARDTFPRLCVSRHNNAFYFSVFAPNTGAKIEISTPYGAPILDELETLVSGDVTHWYPGKSWHKECRCFIRQNGEGMVSCKIMMAAYPEYQERRCYFDLKDADVVFFPPEESMERFEMVQTGSRSIVEGVLSEIPLDYELKKDSNGAQVVVRGVTGNLCVSW